jgi:cation:H+ antiporter
MVDLLLLLGGLALIVKGGDLFVAAAIRIAEFLRMPRVAIGSTLVSLITAIASSRKSVSDLAVGNILGANIANLTLVVGLAAVVHDVTMDRLTQLFNFPAMLVMMGLLLWVLLTDRRVTRREGVVLVVVYGAYLTTLAVVNFALS